jgi:pyruvate,water dikinase
MYADLTLILRRPLLRRGMISLLSQLDALAPQAVRQVLRRPEFRGPQRSRLQVSAIKGALKIVSRVWSALWRRNLTGFVDQTNALMDEYIAQVARSLEAHQPGKEQLQAVLDVLPDFFAFFLNWVPEAAAGITATRLLTRLAQSYLSPDEREALSLGLPGNVVNEMNWAIGDLVDLACGDPRLSSLFEQLGEDGNQWIAQAAQHKGSAPFLAAWEAFLSRYGSRGPSEIDLRQPRWYEDPTPVLRVIAGFLDGDQGCHRALEGSLIDRREAALQRLCAAAGTGLLGAIRVRAIRRLYYTMTHVGGMREHHKFLVVRLLALIKETLKRNAQQLAASGKLDQTDDIWFLTWKELCSIWDQNASHRRGLIARRRADLERFERLSPPLIVTSDGESPVVQYQVDAAPEGALLGNPVSPGVVEGTVHVLRDSQRETLTAGEILVTEFTDPGWTPLFVNAGGVILEVGGALTHGAVVAREYGIPAIVGVRDATTVLQTGQRVRVDGNRGIVEII